MDIAPKPIALMEILRPHLDQVMRLMVEAPTNGTGKCGLAVLVAQYFFVAAAASMEREGKGTPDDLCEILKLGYSTPPTGGESSNG